MNSSITNLIVLSMALCSYTSLANPCNFGPGPIDRGPSITPIGHVSAPELLKPLPIYSHATTFKDFIFTSGIQGFMPNSLEFPSDDAAAQMEQALLNMQSILTQSGSSLNRVLKLTIFFADINQDFSAVNEVINKYFPNNPPARSSVGAADLPRNARVVIECIAVATRA